MKPENGIKERMAERDNVNDDGESEETEQFTFAREQQPWQEAMNIIATKGFIIGTKI